MNRRKIGVMGGSGLYEPHEFEVRKELELDTPFGKPSDTFHIVDVEGIEVVFLSRHGRGHLIPAPSVNFRANIYAMKMLGVDTLISVSAVGTMKEEVAPTEIVIPNQFIDFTKNRQQTFFEDTPAIHISFADPTCPYLSGVLHEGGIRTGAKIHPGGTYVCIEGPAFSTRAESRLFRSWGVDIIGMTAATEAKLAREAEMCYASLSLVTDYDVWKEREEVSGDMILKNMALCIESAKEIIRVATPSIAEETNGNCTCRQALSDAIVSDLSRVPEEKMNMVKVLLEKYLQ
ncbi:MAG: S-methyl-5'-thioadenosine phosphorylase [Actinomycetota bacterium]|nr:S-methyl-5'-thioadenosine phosphorylase [Actinomycetota bacterium]